MTADDTFEHLYREWESNGYDTTEMRATHAAIDVMPVGDPTPPHGTVMVEPMPPALHEGINEPPEGKFYLPPFSSRPGRHYNIADLRRQVSRLRLWVTGLTMSFVSLCVVLWVRW